MPTMHSADFASLTFAVSRLSIKYMGRPLKHFSLFTSTALTFSSGSKVHVGISRFVDKIFCGQTSSHALHLSNFVQETSSLYMLRPITLQHLQKKN